LYSGQQIEATYIQGTKTGNKTIDREEMAHNVTFIKFSLKLRSNVYSTVQNYKVVHNNKDEYNVNIELKDTDNTTARDIELTLYKETFKTQIASAHIQKIFNIKSGVKIIVNVERVITDG